MKNEDLNKTLLEDLQNAQSPEQMAQALQGFAVEVEGRILKEARAAAIDGADGVVLAARGVRTLTTEEKTYYAKVASAMRSTNPLQSLSDLDVVMPKTVIESVFEDLTSEHSLLGHIDFQATESAIEFIYNADGVELAQWGPLTDGFKKELSSGFKKLALNFFKLSAFLPISKAMLDLGPEWLDRYIRVVLSEALIEGIEEGIINGNGKDMPIGMNRDLSKPSDPSSGIPAKATVALNALTPDTYAPILAKLAKSPRMDGENARSRAVTKVLFIVNPVDYLAKVYPATTLQTAAGSYVNDVFPFPTVVVQSSRVPVGKAIMGLPGRYFFGLGTQQSGKLMFSDDVKFLDDERVYAIKLYGNGTPKDNGAYVYLDISKLKVTLPKIETVTAPVGA